MQNWLVLTAFWPAVADGRLSLYVFQNPLFLLFPAGALLLSFAVQHFSRLRILFLFPCMYLVFSALQNAGHLFLLSFFLPGAAIGGILLCGILSLWILRQKEERLLLFFLPVLPLFLGLLFSPRQALSISGSAAMPDLLPLLLPAAIQKTPAGGSGVKPFLWQAMLLFDFLLLCFLAFSRLPPQPLPITGLAAVYGKPGHYAAVFMLYTASILQCTLALKGIISACQSGPRLFSVFAAEPDGQPSLPADDRM